MTDFDVVQSNICAITLFFACADVDECAANSQTCNANSQGTVCTNNLGSFTCSNCSALGSSITSFYQRAGSCCRRSK